MKKKTIIVGLAIATLFTFNQNAEAKTFKDVDEAINYNYNEIENLSKLGVISGYNDGTFRPQSNVTMSQVSKVINESLKKSGINKSKPFTTNKKGNKTVTKAELVQMVVENFDIPKSNAKEKTFKDVKSNQWYHSYIKSAHDAGVVTGNHTENFNPNSLATREDLAKFTSRAINWSENKGKSSEETIFNRIDETSGRVTKAPNSYESMLEGLKNNDEWIYYDMNELKTSEEVSKFITEEFYRGVSSRFFIKQWTTYYITGKVKVEYLRSPEESKKMIEQTDAKVEEILSKIIKPNYNDFDKVKAVHDYLVLNVEYDLDVYNNINKDPMSYTIYGTVFNGIATCDGYARTVKSMLSKLGIESHYVTGYVENGGYHAWNLVKVDNPYYYLDATWNDPIGMGEDYIQYDYFLLDKKTMAKDRTWETQNLPEATSKKYLN